MNKTAGLHSYQQRSEYFQQECTK